MKIAVAAALLTLAAGSIQAGPLTEARIARIINDVSVIKPADGAHPASLNELIKDDLAVKTGIKSRSELLFSDETLTRLGPESLFSFKTGTRDMSLERGAMLLQVPKGIGGAQIHSAAVTASITGTTIMLEHVPGKTLKVLVLEGSLSLAMNGNPGDAVVLLPGKMVIMAPDAKSIPKPVSIDISKVMKTSALVNMGEQEKPLPSVALIQSEIETQAKTLNTQDLVATNLAVEASDVRVASDNVARAVDTHIAVAITEEPTLQSTPSSTPSSTPVPAATPAATATPASSATPAASATPVPSATPSATATPAATATPSSTATPSATATPAPSATPAATATPTASATPAPTATPAPSPSDSIDAPIIVEYGSDAAPGKDLTIDKPLDLSANGKHGNFTAISKGKIEIKKSIKVSSNAKNGGSKAGGNITLDSRKTKDDAIVVSDSGDLLSLLNAAAPGSGGVIKFRSSGGRIKVDKADITAERGTIDIQNQGENGEITLNKANLSAETIKVQALGKNGQLNIGGGTLNADTTIDLFAVGSNGQVNFTENTTLSGKSVKRIAGDSVTIKNGKTVTVNGPAPANVFTNHANYSGSGGNGSTNGQFGGAGATTQPLASLPTGH